MSDRNPNNIKQINKFCYECEGNGCISSCCQAAIYDGKCCICGRYTKKEGDVKTFRGTITEIIDDLNVMVKVKYGGIHKLSIDDIEVI